MEQAFAGQADAPPTADFAAAAARVRSSFDRQATMRLIGRVRKAGRTITVAEGKAWAIRDDGTRKLIATMTGTLMTVRDRDGIQG